MPTPSLGQALVPFAVSGTMLATAGLAIVVNPEGNSHGKAKWTTATPRPTPPTMS